MIKNFQDLWRAHFDWSQGTLVKEIKSLKTANVYLGSTLDEWFNFALPRVKKPTDLDLTEIKKILSPVSPPTTIYLLEKHVKAGFPKFLTRNSYQFMGTDTWVVLKSPKEPKVDIPIKHISPAQFSDYNKVTFEAFKEGGYDDRPYNEICRQSLTGEMKSKASNFSSEFFMVYEDQRPVAGAGLFLTKEVGYFHNDATLKKYRKKGYNLALIKQRIRFCWRSKVPILYSIVEKDSQSYRNYCRCGFEPWQVAQLFTLRNK